MVRFENVGLRYGLGPEVLRDLTFRVEPDSFQFLTGPSGAGKTSLLRLLFASLRPTRGLISLFGHDIAVLSKDAQATLRRLKVRCGLQPCSTTSPPTRTWRCRSACSAAARRAIATR